MLTRWNTWSDFEDMFSAMNQLRAYMDRVFSDGWGSRPWEARVLPVLGSTWPRANVLDKGSAITLTAEVPGLSDKDVNVSLNQDVLTLAGERKTDGPKGYSTHRQERPEVKFSRSFTLPCRVNPDSASATVKNGILTVTIEKAAEAKPRQISVKAS